MCIMVFFAPTPLFLSACLSCFFSVLCLYLCIIIHPTLQGGWAEGMGGSGCIHFIHVCVFVCIYVESVCRVGGRIEASMCASGGEASIIARKGQEREVALPRYFLYLLPPLAFPRTQRGTSTTDRVHARESECLGIFRIHRVRMRVCRQLGREGGDRPVCPSIHLSIHRPITRSCVDKHRTQKTC